MVVKKRAATKRAPAKRKPSKKKRNGFGIRTLVTWSAILAFLFFSLLVLGYVVFLRTVEAAEVQNNTEHLPTLNSPASTAKDLPRMAIIIDDMGFHPKVGDALLNLPYALTYSFLPHAPFTQDLVEVAYQEGKTILLHLPMQPKGEEWNPGVGALLVNDPFEEQTQLLLSNLSLVPYAIGVNNHMGSLYTEHEDLMEKVLLIIKEKGLFFVDSYTTANSVGYNLAQKLEIKTARRHVFLDNVNSVKRICTQLDQLVELAEQQGEAVGIGHPKQETYEALKQCLPKYNERITIVGVEKVVK